MMKEVKVDGITITGMSKNQARNAILKEYPWNMTVTYDGDTYNVTNLAAEKVDALLDEIYSGEPAESYTLNMDGLEEAAAGEAENCAAKWNKKGQKRFHRQLRQGKRRFCVRRGKRMGLPLTRKSWQQTY